MTWQSVLLSMWHHVAAWLSAIGLTGGGVGFIKYMKHVPAPYQDQTQWGAFFDTIQDLVSNSRIGERRTRSGVDVPAVPKPAPVPEPQAASANSATSLENPAPETPKPDLPVFGNGS